MNVQRVTVFLALASVLWFMCPANAEFIYQLEHYDQKLGAGWGPDPLHSAVALNQFTVVGANRKITSVLMDFFGNSPDPDIVTAGVWSDPNQDGNPIDAKLLGSVAQVGDASQLFQRFDLTTPVDVGDAGTSFFVGAIWNSTTLFEREVLVSFDNFGSGMRSFKVHSNPPLIPFPIDPDDLSHATLANVGAFLIRAEGIPEPSSLLLAAAGLFCVLRLRTREPYAV